MNRQAGRSFATHLECSRCHVTAEADRLQNVCSSCRSPLLVRYDLAAIRILGALRESSGTAVAVPDDEIAAAMGLAGTRELLLCPEGAAGLAAVSRLVRSGWIAPTEEVVLFNTGTGLKYAESLQGAPPRRLGDGEGLPRSAIGDVVRERS